MSDIQELKPCPFCGSECDPNGWKGMGNGGLMSGPECAKCGATAESVESWNRRVVAEQAVPDGYMLVPVVPTEQMIIHGFESDPDESFSTDEEWEAYEAMSGCQQAAHRAKLCYAAMLAAAPELTSD